MMMMMMNIDKKELLGNEKKPESAFLKFITANPIKSITLYTSLSAFLLSARGFIQEFFILSEFGYNYAHFAEPSDFLIAGLNNPVSSYLILVIFSMAITAVIAYQRSKKHILSNKIWLFACIIMMSAFFAIEIL